MNKTINSLRLFFCFFSGEDDFIIRKCDERIQFSFAIIGLFVLFIFGFCWTSASLFMAHLFEDTRWLGIPIGIIWAMLVTNLYLLLLYTISPQLLPIVRKKKIIENGKVKKLIINEKKKIDYFLIVSVTMRITFICLIAIIVVQPFNVLIFSPSFDEADLYAKEIRSILSNHPLAWITTILSCILFVLPIYLKYQVRAISKSKFASDFIKHKGASRIMEIRDTLLSNDNFDKLKALIQSTDINSVRTSDFYFQKTLIEYRLILDEYDEFKKNYSLILENKNKEYNRRVWEGLLPILNNLEKIDLQKLYFYKNQLLQDLQVEEISKYEYFLDPPFRTRTKIQNRSFLPEEYLLSKYYNKQS